MRYILTKADKRRQMSVVRQLWRLTVLSRRFMKLTRQGSCKQFDRSTGSRAAA
jgi:hypothetical protein